jgi:hypothetical protein
VFWARTMRDDPDPSAVGRFIYDCYYTNPNYNQLWVTYGGKPLLITTELLPGNLSVQFTVRKMWGLQGSLAERE